MYVVEKEQKLKFFLPMGPYRLKTYIDSIIKSEMDLVIK